MGAGPEMPADGAPKRARLIAFYLPQFHPIPLNDRVFGPGFTEWYDVASARPLFRGHRQPVLPGELGFYDLRLAETRFHQAALAREHGIEGFCYWHYWSDGQRLLERPFEEVLKSGEPDFPFCLGWANHSWHDYRGNQQTTFHQHYLGLSDHRAHFRHVESALHDPRYMRVDGKPICYLFRPAEVPDLEVFCEAWRDMAIESGFPGLHIVGQARRPQSETTASRLAGALDATVFVPGHPPWSERSIITRVSDRIRGGPRRHRYEDFLASETLENPIGDSCHPAVLTNWDNTPRWGRSGFVLLDPTPEAFGRWVDRAIGSVAHRPPGQRLVFVKSWNEWAEGNYLEPDAHTGRARLDALKMAVVRHPGQR